MDERHVAFDTRDTNIPQSVKDMMKVSELTYKGLSNVFRSLMTSGDHPLQIVGGMTAAIGKTLGKLAVTDAIMSQRPKDAEALLDDLLSAARANAMLMITAHDANK